MLKLKFILRGGSASCVEDADLDIANTKAITQCRGIMHFHILNFNCTATKPLSVSLSLWEVGNLLFSALTQEQVRHNEGHGKLLPFP